MSADGVEFRLVDSDLISNEKVLENATGRAWYIQHNQPGSGQFTIPVEDIKAVGIDVGKYVKVYYRGALRGGFWIENIDKKEITPGEYSDKLMSCTGRGTLAILDEAIVWDYLTPALDTVRKFTGVTKGSMLADLLDEAKNPHLPSMDRKCFPMLSWSFTAAQDSLGNAWGDSEDMEFAIGMYYLEIQRQFADLGIDFSISLNPATGALTLAAYKNPLGSDLHTTVKFRAGLNCLETSQTKTMGNLRNRVLVHYKDDTSPYDAVNDAASQAAYRPRETLLQAENAAGNATAIDFATQELNKLKDPELGIGLRFQDDPSWANPTNGNEVFANWSVADTISYDNGSGTEVSYRVMGMQLSWEGDNPYASITLELNRVLNTYEMRQAMDAKKLSSSSVGSALQTAPNSTVALTFHDIVGALHVTSGRTAGQVIIASAATTFGWSTWMLSGTAAQTYTFPSVGGTVAIIGIVNTFVSGQVFGTGAGVASITINGAAANQRDIYFCTAGNLRWILQTDSTAESGSNGGSDFKIMARADDGSYLSTPFFIKRSDGNTGFGTTSPGSYLAGLKGVTIYQSDYPGLSLANSTAYWLFYVDGSTLYYYANAGIRMTINNVGVVGLTSDLYTKQVIVPNNTAVYFQDSAGGYTNYIVMYHANTNNFVLGAAGTADIGFYTGGTVRVLVTNAGHLEIKGGHLGFTNSVAQIVTADNVYLDIAATNAGAVIRFTVGGAIPTAVMSLYPSLVHIYKDLYLDTLAGLGDKSLRVNNSGQVYAS